MEAIKRKGKDSSGRYNLMALIKIFENVDLYLVMAFFMYWCAKWYTSVKLSTLARLLATYCFVPHLGLLILQCMSLCSQKYSWFTVRLIVKKGQHPGTGFLKVSASVQRSNRLLLLWPYYQVSFEETPKLLTILSPFA